MMYLFYIQHIKVLIVLVLVLKVYSYNLRCPENLHRTHRVKSLCNTTLHSSYSCLENEHTNAFEESCNQEPNYVRPGQRYVINGFRTNTDCSEMTYQPFKFWSQKYSQCTFLKSLCSGIGQMFYENNSTTEDSKCRCNHNDGYAFIVKPINTCYCVPTEEDCTCFKKKCSSNNSLSSEYDCVSILISSEFSLCHDSIYTRNTDKLYNQSLKSIDKRQLYNQGSYTVLPNAAVIISVTVIFCLTLFLTGHCQKIIQLFKSPKNDEDLVSSISGEHALEIKHVEMNSHNSKIWPTATSITVSWDKHQLNIDNCHAVKYRIHGMRKFKNVSVSVETEKIHIEELQSNTLYDVKVYLSEKDDTNYTVLNSTCRTNESCARFLKSKASAYIFKKMRVYRLIPVLISPKETNTSTDFSASNTGLRVRTCDIIKKYEPGTNTSEEKSLLILGATGTGKSTLIDALINYVAEVSYHDDHRFSLINLSTEEKLRTKKQHESQTSSVTIYRLPNMNCFKINFKLNIIDTPGFDDTRQSFDKIITTQIRDLFKNKISHLDAILIVVPMSTTRLTEGQRYVFSSILSMFGKDIAKNVFVAITQYDGGNDDNVLDVLTEANVPFNQVFKFSNAFVLHKFDPDVKKNNLEPTPEQKHSMWENRTKSFRDLFETLETTPKTTVKESLDVMRARIQLEIQLSAFEENIAEQAQIIANYTTKEYGKVLEAISNKSHKNQKCVTYTALMPKITRQFHFIKSINCNTCEKTCHGQCWVPFDNLMWTCEVMTQGKCEVCKCDISIHNRDYYSYVLTYENKVLSCQDAVDNQQKREKCLSIFRKTLKNINKLTKELQEKALVKSSVDLSGYIKNLIEKEISAKKEGFEMRRQILQTVLEHTNRKKSIEELTIESFM